MQVLLILFAAAFTFLTCLFLGKSLLKLLHTKLYRSEELFFGFVLGATCLSAIVLVLGVTGLAYSWVFLLIGCSSFAIAYACGAFRFTKEHLKPPPRSWTILFTILYAIFAVLYLGNALAPEASSDGSLFHVALPALYLREHRIPPITTNFLATFSEGMEMLFLFAFAFGKHSATAMVHLLFGLLMPIGMLSYARRVGAPVAGVIGSLLFFLSPMTAESSTTAYVDVGVTAVIFAVFYLVQIWRAGRDNLLLIPLGLIAGFGFAIKYTAFIAVAYAVGAIVFRSRRSAIIVCLCALAVMSPWLIKNAIIVHNPVSPFANRVFPNPYMYVSTENTYRHNMGSFQGMTVWRVPYEVTVRGARTQGFLGPLFLLSPLALLALGVPAGRQLVIAAAVFTLPFFSYPVARILLPALPFISLALGIVVSRWKQAALVLIILQAISAWPSVIPKYASRNTIKPEFPDWRAALRITPESTYLRSRMGDYGIDELLETKVPPSEQVFSFNGFAQSYHTRKVLVEWQSALGVRLGESLLTAAQTWRQPTQRIGFHLEPRALREIRVNGVTSVSELRVFNNGAELARKPGWRLRAYPNPWDVQAAFDNSPLTRWAIRGQTRPQTFIELDFGKTETLDEIKLDCNGDQSANGLSLDGIPAKIETTHIAMPERPRRAAIEELERHNIRWLVVQELDPLAHDYRLRGAQWGITLAGEARRFRLYHLD